MCGFTRENGGRRHPTPVGLGSIMSITITTNNVPRAVLDSFELTAAIRYCDDDMDYVVVGRYS